MKYNHMVDICFTVVSDDFYARDVTPEMLRSALLKRIATLNESDVSEWLEACLPPIDTHVEEADNSVVYDGTIDGLEG